MIEENIWSEFKEWENVRAGGAMRFILRRGIFLLGTALASGSCLALLTNGENNPWHYVFAAWTGWLIGAAHAWIHWHYAEKEFLKEEKKKEESITDL